MIMKANKQIGFIYKDNESIDRILKDGDVVFERGFLREKTSTTLPITFGGVGKDLKDYKIYGNTYQNSTRGVNLFNHYLYPASRGYNGITITNNGDGSFTLNGTCTSNNTAFALGVDTEIQQYANEGRVTQTAYYISGTCTKGSSSNARTTIRLNYDTGSDRMIPLQNLSTQGIISKTHPQDSRETGWSWRIVLDAGDTFDNFTIKYQLEKGSEATEYEPYTGGQPSPNPDYPQEIISCGDLITDSQDENYGKYKIPVNVRSDNLFDKSNATKLNGTISTSYDRFEGGGLNYAVVIPCKSNTTYTVKKRNDGNTNRFALASSETIPSSTSSELTPLLNRIRVDNSSNLSLTTGSTANYLVVQYYRTAESVLTEQQILDSIMIVEGSTVPSKYIPYYNETTNIYLDEPLRKTKDGTYVDYIDFINQKVYRQLGRTEFSNSSGFAVNAVITLFVQYLTPAIENLKLKIPDAISFENNYFYCNYLRNFGGSTASSSKIRINIPHEYLGTTSSSTSAEARTALTNLMSGKKMEFVYPLETPTEESITLPNVPTIDGNNTLNIETEITPSQVYIKYKSNE